jgi:hypothetical protein
MNVEKEFLPDRRNGLPYTRGSIQGSAAPLSCIQILSPAIMYLSTPTAQIAARLS